MTYRLIDKLISLLLIIGLNWFGVLGVFKTFAFFDDHEEIQESTIGASVLDFALESIDDFAPQIEPSKDSLRKIKVVNNKDLEIDYDVLIVVNDIGLCKELDLVVERNNVLIYSGRLVDFSLFSLNLPSLGVDIFDLTATLSNSDSYLWGKICNFDLLFEGVQEDGEGFSDREVLSGGIVSGVWDDTDEPEIPEVIINEIMWMGSMDDDDNNKIKDEWIELRNMTDHVVDIGKWVIENAKSANKKYMIPASRSIPAYGYFLIANHPEQSANSNLNVNVDQPNGNLNFNNVYSSNGQLKLKDSKGNVVDETPVSVTDVWPKGENLTEKKWSMERNLTPGDGFEVDNWHTCDSDIMTESDLLTMQSYWNVDAQLYNCGTPGHVNLSKNDPTAPDYDSGIVQVSSGSSNVVAEDMRESLDDVEKEKQDEEDGGESEEEEVFNKDGTDDEEADAEKEDSGSEEESTELMDEENEEDCNNECDVENEEEDIDENDSSEFDDSSNEGSENSDEEDKTEEDENNTEEDEEEVKGDEEELKNEENGGDDNVEEMIGDEDGIDDKNDEEGNEEGGEKTEEVAEETIEEKTEEETSDDENKEVENQENTNEDNTTNQDE